MDIRQTSEYAQYMRKLGWVVEEKDNVYYFVKKFPIIGSFIKLQRPEKIDLKFIELLQKKYRAFRVIIEPKNAIGGFKQTNSPFLPSKTLVIDLTKDFEKNFKKDVKYSLRKTQDLQLHEAKNISDFRKQWKKSVPFNRYIPSLSDLENLKKAFGEKCLFLEYEKNAGAIFLVGDKTAYYWLAFTDKSARKKLVQYKIVYEGLLWAKKMRAKQFDFEGIYDERFPLKSWKGFTHFKKSFGGKIVEYLGAFKK